MRVCPLRGIREAAQRLFQATVQLAQISDQLVVTLVVITIVGVLTSLWSVRIALKSPILQMLRGE